MKLIHLSDLHIGKWVNGFSMLDDQAFILKEILSVIEEEEPDAVLIAGDIYDKPVPPAEAVSMFDSFLTELSAGGREVFVISGNHDSSERVAFGARLMERAGIHISPVYDGTVRPVSLSDADGEVRIYMLPFLKPSQVRRFFPEEEITDYTTAMGTAIRAMEIDTSCRNVLVTHQFVTGASRSESEEISVGGTDNVDASVFEGFDYVALGHIHGPQNVGKETIRYCGTPLKYSFSEAKHVKSVTIVELGAKGDISVRMKPLTPFRDLREIRGSYMEVTAKSFYEGTETGDYIRVTLTDEDDIPDAIRKLRTIYPNIMKLDYDNKRTRTAREIDGDEAVEEKTPLALFAEFYEKQNNQPMSESQALYAERLIRGIWEA